MKNILITVYLLMMSFTICYSQEKELHTEKDGFQWYLLKKDEFKGVADKKGNTLIPTDRKYNTIYYIHLEGNDRGYFRVDNDNGTGVCNLQGIEIISPKYDVVTYFINDDGYKYFVVYNKDMKQGVCDLTGKELIPPIYDGVVYSDNNFKVCQNNEYVNTGIQLSKKDILGGNDLSKLLRTDEKNNFKWYLIIKGDYVGAESSDGKPLIPVEYEQVNYKCDHFYNNGFPYFEVKNKNGIGLFDISGKELISTDRNYSEISYKSSLEHPYFLITKNGKKGACDLSGKEVISPIYYFVNLTVVGFTTQLTDNSEEIQTEIRIDSKGLLVDNSNPTDAYSQYNLGLKYLSDRKFNEAFKWFNKSAQQNYVQGEYAVGLCYDFGNGVKQDKQKALDWYRKAESHGYEAATQRITDLTQPVITREADVNYTNQDISNTVTSKKSRNNVTAQNNVPYLDILRKYENKCKIPDLGPYEKSEKIEQTNGNVTYNFYGKDGAIKTISFLKCWGPFCNNGKCTGFHLGMVCLNCGNSGNHIECGGTGTRILISGQLSWGYYTSDGMFHSTGSASNVNTNNANTNVGNYDSSSNNSANHSVYTTCTSCGGSGVCQRCHGECGSWSDTGYYTGSNVKSWINCTSCRGSGKCTICYGRGKL